MHDSAATAKYITMWTLTEIDENINRLSDDETVVISVLFDKTFIRNGTMTTFHDVKMGHYSRRGPYLALCRRLGYVRGTDIS